MTTEVLQNDQSAPTAFPWQSRTLMQTDEATSVQESMVALAELTMMQAELDLTQSLLHIATLAVCAIPGSDGASVMVFGTGDRSDTHVANTDFVRALDALQCLINEGPAITAANDLRVVLSGDLSAYGPWPAFTTAATGIGGLSALSIPLVTERRPVGALTMYSHRSHAFTDTAVTIGEQFAIPAAISASNAEALDASSRRLALVR